MGMSDLFVEGVADLSGVDGSNMLYVSKVLHRAVVDVNEEGLQCCAVVKYYLHLNNKFVRKVFCH